MVRILIASTEATTCQAVHALGASRSWQVATAVEGELVMRHLCTSAVDVAILQVPMPSMDSLAILQRCRRKGLHTDFILLAQHATVDFAVEAMKAGARDFLEEPVSPLELVSRVESLLENRWHFIHPLAKRLDTFLQAHADQLSLGVNDLCQQYHISCSYATQLFRRYFSSTFRRRLAYHRVQCAKELILVTDDPLYVVAAKCGFRNHNRLTEAFRRIEGTTPKAYRQNCRGTWACRGGQ